MHYSTSSLKNYHLTASDGVIGHVEDIYFDSHTWTVRYLVVNTGAWLLGKEVLIPSKTLGLICVGEKSIRVNLSLDKVRNAPVSDTALPVSRQDDTVFNDYYESSPGVVPWIPLRLSASPAFGIEPVRFPDAGSSIPADRPAVAAPGDYHLRSAHDVIGHTIRGSDDEIGCVGDFLVDDADWSIRYFIVNTAIWFGKKVVVPTAAIREVSWDERTVYLTLPREQVKHAPEYDASQPPAEREQRLAGLLRPDDRTVSPCPTPLR